MKSFTSTLVALFVIFSLLLIGCSSSGITGGSNNILKLSDINNSFNQFENDTLYDVVSGKYELSSVGMNKYDELFNKTTMLNAKLSLIDYGLNMITQKPEPLKSAMSKSEELSSNLMDISPSELTNPSYLKEKSTQFNNLKNLDALSKEERYPVEILKLAFNELPKTQEEANNLIGQFKSLNPANDFTGLNATKVPGVTAEITSNISDLTGVVSSYPSIVANLGSVITKITK